MSVGLTIEQMKYRARRRWLPVWRRLRREGSLALVMFALALGVGEPLACILHCPPAAMLLSSAAPGHDHHGHHMVARATPVATAAASGAPRMTCHLLGGGLADSLSGNLAPQPEHLAALSILFLALAALCRLSRQALAAHLALDPFERPPDLRPPIALAF